MRCAIMQPTYMPWAGYLNLMLQVDLFIYLDDAQYERSSWQNRNRVLINGEPAWLTVPVTREFLGAPIDQVVVDDRLPWRRKHATMLQNTYARHPHAGALAGPIAGIADGSRTGLADLNISLLEIVRQQARIATPVTRSSELGISGSRSARLVAMLAHVGATEYVTPPGALAYLREDSFSSLTACELLVHDFVPAPYAQRGRNGFESHLSVLDVIANLGWDGLRDYIRPSTPCLRQFKE